MTARADTHIIWLLTLISCGRETPLDTGMKNDTFLDANQSDSSGILRLQQREKPKPLCNFHDYDDVQLRAGLLAPGTLERYR